MKKNILIIVLAFIVVGLIGFITYDNFFSAESKDNLEETNKADEVVEKTADERYTDYLANLSKSIEENYGTDNEGGYRQYYSVSNNGAEYTVEINKKEELLLTYHGDLQSKFNNYKLADDVVSFFLVYYGNGGYQSLYYIKANGEVHNALIEQIQDDATIRDEIVDVKNVVEVKSGLFTDENGLGGRSVFFVDIDGNIFTPNKVE